MKVTLTVNVEVERMEGMNASRQNIVEALIDYPEYLIQGETFEVETAGDYEATYEVTDIEIEEVDS